ncbi:MAG: CHAT domain-containing protein [Alphaproteobacteria bacterium]
MTFTPLLRLGRAGLLLGTLLFAGPAAGDALGDGAAAYAGGDYPRAIELWSEALGEAGDDAGRQAALARRAAAYGALADDAKAIADLSDAVDLARAGTDDEALARLRAQLGKAYLLSGQPEAAATELQLALAIARPPGLRAAILNDLGNLQQQRDPEAAGESYAAARRLAEAGGDRALLAASNINLGRLALGAGDVGATEDYLSAAHAALAGLPASAGRASDLVAIGRLLLDAEDRAAQTAPSRQALAYAALRDGLQAAEAIGDPRSRAYALGTLGRLYEGRGRLDEAMRLTRAALFEARSVAAPEIVYRWHWQLGRLWRAKGDLAQARDAYALAIDALQRIRSDLVFGYSGGESSFQASVKPVFVEYADLLLREADTLAGQAMTDKIIAARGAVELLRTAELEEYFQDDCVAALQSKVTGIDRLADRTAALYPIILGDRLELLLSLPSGLLRKTIAVDEATVSAEVLNFRQLLEKRTTRQYIRPARQLYDWMIRPFADQFAAEQVDTLVVIPNGPLLTIPLAALHDGEKHLAESMAVAVVPGLTLLDPRPIPRQNIQVLINGLTESVQGFAPLPAVAGEMAAIERIFGGRVLRDRDFQIRRMQSELDATPYAMIHIASHAQISSEARDSFLLAYDGKLSMDGLEKFVKLSQFRDDPVELLTLSACATAAGDERAALGLAGIAIKAGARSAVASLWFINDAGTSTLIADFYDRLSDPATSKAKALQQAQIALMADRRYRHPIYWAPFLLIGNWL